MKYRVLSANFAHKKGAVLTDEQLLGCNVRALVAAGHLAEAPESPAKQKEQKTDG